jgi:hypothetical protein
VQRVSRFGDIEIPPDDFTEVAKLLEGHSLREERGERRKEKGERRKGERGYGIWVGIDSYISLSMTGIFCAHVSPFSSRLSRGIT